jgi:hypothetical protein
LERDLELNQFPPPAAALEHLPKPLAVDLNHNLFQGFGLSGASAASPLQGSRLFSQSVSIQRVKMPKVLTISNKARMIHNCAVERKHGWQAVNLHFARALLERCSASSRSLPVTISFATIESKLPETTSPETTPESTLTPGPMGQEQLNRTRSRQEVLARVLAIDAEFE